MSFADNKYHMPYTLIQSASFRLPGRNRLFIKREDTLPFSFGGNKVRIANAFYNDMLVKNKNLMIGYGNSRSNLCRALSHLCTSKNMPIWIVSPADDDGACCNSFNRNLVIRFNTKIISCRKTEVAATIHQTIYQAEKQGYAPYYMNGDCYGRGNEATPVQAYVDVYKEIIQQAKAEARNYHYIFLATGTGMTHAGLICGRTMFHDRDFAPEIVGISIARPVDKARACIENYVTAYMESNGAPCNNQIRINVADHSCGGYGRYNKEVEDIIFTLLAKDGIALDPVYTGKAFCGMLKYLKEQKIEGCDILFIHTGSNPLFFDWLSTQNQLG